MKRLILPILVLIILWLCSQITIPITAGIIGYFDKSQDKNEELYIVK